MEKYIVFHIDGGAGKSVAATAVCASLSKAHPDRKLIVVTAWPEVFLHNPRVYRVYKTGNFGYFYEDFIKNKDTIVLRTEPYHTNDFIHRKKHLIQIWCDLFNIPNTNPQPELYLTQRELIHAERTISKKGKVLLFQISGGADDNEYYSWARDMPVMFAQQLVNQSKSNFDKILHVKKEKQPALENTFTVTDTLRNLFCYVYLSDKLVLIDSLIQHVAAALNKPAVVGWIGNSPTVFGYDIHKNVLPSQKPVFRHLIDSYLDESDWTGKRHFECPYDDVNNIFQADSFLDYILDKTPNSKGDK